MQLDINNINIRDAIHNIIRFIVDEILATAFKIRQYDSGWSNNDYYSNLPKSQRVWLDNVYQDERLAQIEWKEGISQEIARWVLKSYEKSILGSYMLGDIELQKISKIVIEAIEQDKEFF
jgi:CRISPR-associated protein Csy1